MDIEKLPYNLIKLAIFLNTLYWPLVLIHGLVFILGLYFDSNGSRQGSIYNSMLAHKS